LIGSAKPENAEVFQQHMTIITELNVYFIVAEIENCVKTQLQGKKEIRLIALATEPGAVATV